jgi:hypothetical protein
MDGVSYAIVKSCFFLASSSDQFDEWFDLEIDDEQAKKKHDFTIA